MHLGEDLKPAQPRHHLVEDNQIWSGRLYGVPSVDSICSPKDNVARSFKSDLYHLPNDGLVFGEHDNVKHKHTTIFNDPKLPRWIPNPGGLHQLGAREQMFGAIATS